jgi:hypothetical protein
MSRPILLAYQVLIGASDALTGALLIVAPELTLRLMGVHVPADALVYLQYIGAFVLSVGLACLYGALAMLCGGKPGTLQTVWLLTAFTRASVAVFVVTQVLGQVLEPAWLTVAATDGACVLIQAIGLRKGWLDHVAR